MHPQASMAIAKRRLRRFTRWRRSTACWSGSTWKTRPRRSSSFELLNRNVDQPYKFNGTWVIDEWSKIGVKVTQRVLPTGTFGEAFRSGDLDEGLDGDCQNIVNPLLDGTTFLLISDATASIVIYGD